MPLEPPSAASLPVLLMRVSGQTFAMRQREVAEILPLPRLASFPEMPPIVLGAFHLGGALVLVFRMASLLGLSQPAVGDPLYHHLLLLQDQPRRLRFAVMVDRATDILIAEPRALPPGESFNDCVDADIRVDGALVPVVRADRLLTVHERARMAAFAARAETRDAAFATPDPA